MNTYCDKDKKVTNFVFKRTAEGTYWQCEECKTVIHDLTKYKALYSQRLQRTNASPLY